MAMCIIRKNYDPILKKRGDKGRTDGQKDRRTSDFIGHCPTNLECPTNCTKNRDIQNLANLFLN